jgi:hypothetical protein
MKLVNKSNRDMSKLNPFVKDFLPFAQKYMKFDKLPTIMYYSDQDNAAKTLGRTAHYDPSANQVVLYVDDRHPKDIMRSLSHELVHHKQNCGGQFKGGMAGEQGYAQNDPHLREMEREAYELGNMCFRDWEDTRRDYLQENKYYKGESKMSLKEWKNKELNRLLMEKWGLRAEGEKPDYIDIDGDGDKEESMKDAAKDKDKGDDSEVKSEGMYNRSEEEDDEMKEGAASSSRGEHDDRNGDDERKRPLEEDEDIFAPNHYCVHHGGVSHNGSVQMAEAVSHSYNVRLGKVTHYNMKLSDGTILENVAAEDIQVTDASLAEGHGGHMSRQDREEEDMAKARKQRKEREGHQRQIREDDDDAEAAEQKAVDDNKPNPSGMKGRIKGMLGLEERIHKAIKEAIMDLKS